jgi:hypothetical protein
MNTKQQTKLPIKLQRWGGSFQVEVISDPSVKQSLFGWMSAQELGPQSGWRIANMLSSKSLGVLKHARMFVSKRPGPARTGYLCFYPPLKVAIYIEDTQTDPKICILRMRHSPAVYAAGGAIFAATLSVAESTLWIEDVLFWEGKTVWAQQRFTERWALLKNWFENDWSEDTAMQRGLSIKPCQPQPLTEFTPDAGDVWEFIPDDPNRRRLIWKDKRIKKIELSNYPQRPKAAPKPRNTIEPTQQQQPQPAQTVQVGILDTYFPALASPNDGSLVAIAKKDLSGPDVYTLFTADMKSLGIAVIRKMAISHAMRAQTTDATRVRVEWNTSFDRWEIHDVNVAAGASPQADFTKNIGGK